MHSNSAPSTARQTPREQTIARVYFAIRLLGGAQRADEFYARASAAPSDNAIVQIAREYLALVPHDEDEA